MQEYLNKNISPTWVSDVYEAKDLLLRGKEAGDQINILGDDGVPLAYHERLWKSELLDRIILQQDGFDKVDKSTPMKRQSYMLELVLKICRYDYDFESYEEVQPYYTTMINAMRQMNYVEFQSDRFKEYQTRLDEIVNERRAK